MPRPNKHSKEFYAAHLPTALAAPRADVKVIAKYLGVPLSTLYYTIKKLGLSLPRDNMRASTPAAMPLTRAHTKPPKPIKPAIRKNYKTDLWVSRTDALRQAVVDGYTVHNLASIYEVPTNTIHYWLRRLNIPSPSPRTLMGKAELRELRQANAAAILQRMAETPASALPPIVHVDPADIGNPRLDPYAPVIVHPVPVQLDEDTKKALWDMFDTSSHELSIDKTP